MDRVRWWPAAAIVGLGLAWLGGVWLLSEASRQDKVIGTIVATGTVLVLLLLWLVALSRLPWRVRVGGLLAFMLLVGLARGLLRIRGVTGDFVPILEWRWTVPVVVHPSVTARLPAPGAVAPTPGAVAGAAPARVILPESRGEGQETAARVAPAPIAPSSRDYPQFLGPERNGTVPGVRLARDWSARPPRRLWRQAIGPGWSGLAVSEASVVTQEQQGEDELVVSYELRTGAVRWRHADRARYATVIAGEGPRATPTLSGDRAYTLGATGLLNALDLRTGARIWSRNVVGENGAESPPWGKSCSPLVLDELVIVSAGGAGGKSLVAYDRETGRLAWAGGSDGSGYGSPMMAELAGRKQILIFNRGSVAAHDPKGGAVLWEHPWPSEQPNVCQPLPLPGDRVLVSAGYGIGSKVFQVVRTEEGGLKASLVWESPRLKAKFTNIVLHDGFVYGLDDGVLTCLDPTNGERRWRAGRYGHGQVVLVGDLLLVQTEEGEIVLVQPNPSSLTELGRFAALEGKTWNPPALAGAILLVRNDREAAAFEMPLEAP